MRHPLATTAFLVVAAFPLVLKGQTVSPSAGFSGGATWVQPAPFPGGLFGFPNFGVTRAVGFPSFFGYPESFPFTYFYPSLWPPLEVQHQLASRIANGDVEAEVAAQEKEYLASKVQALTDEVESLRQEKTYRQYAQTVAQPPPAETSGHGLANSEVSAHRHFPETIFIYRDGQEMAVRDYAILGDTLWVFNGQVAHKFPLADFNLAASRKVNEQHGVEFPLSIRH